MANFDIAYQRLKPIEGGFVNDPNDSGGATNFGLSSRYLNSLDVYGDPVISSLDDNKDGYIDMIEIKDIKSEEAKKIFKFFWWQGSHYDKLDNQDLANNVFDFAVHAGTYKANVFLQKAINRTRKYLIKEDGIIGPKTIAAANEDPEVLRKYKEERRFFYHAVVNKKPSQEKFLKGWLARIDK